MKKIFVICIAALLLIGLCSVAAFAGGDDNNEYPLPFTDISSSDQCYEAAWYVYDNGMMKGTSENVFSPYREISRAMPLTILWRLEGCPQPENNGYFADVAQDSWYAQAADWAAEAGLILHQGSYLEPDEAATREDVAYMLYAYAAFKGMDTLSCRADISHYSDAENIHDDAYAAMEWIYGVGLISGIDEGSISPDAIANRAQLATMLMRFCKNILPTSDFSVLGEGI